MERIGIVGISIHETDVTGLERVRRPQRDEDWRALADVLGASELVVLATCNRVEVIFAREEGDLPGEADREAISSHLLAATDRAIAPLRFHLFRGQQAIRHLFRVASSLDSLVLGEDQILAQVREAYARGSDLRLTGSLLGPLFHHALQVGKKVRTDTVLSRYPVSVVSLAVRALSHSRPEKTQQIAVIGAGSTATLVVKVLQGHGMQPAVIVNRTVEKARVLAQQAGAEAMTLAAFQRGDRPVDVIFSATSAPGVVLDAATVKRLAETAPSRLPLLVYDLAVPRDVTRLDDPRIVITDMDALRAEADQNRAHREQAAAEAEGIVEDHVATFARRSGEDLAGPAVDDLQRVSKEIFDHELEALLGGRLAHLSDPDRRAVERWARTTFNRLMSLPVTALKRLACDMSAARQHEEAVREVAKEDRQ
jgi:glutamyl-tRNA reductase